jgi:hypothetical protein
VRRPLEPVLYFCIAPARANRTSSRSPSDDSTGRHERPRRPRSRPLRAVGSAGCSTAFLTLGGHCFRWIFLGGSVALRYVAPKTPSEHAPCRAPGMPANNKAVGVPHAPHADRTRGTRPARRVVRRGWSLLGSWRLLRRNGVRRGGAIQRAHQHVGTVVLKKVVNGFVAWATAAAMPQCVGQVSWAYVN